MTEGYDRLEINIVVFFSQSVIMVVFRDDKSVEDEQKAWEFWHSRQHSHKQRVIDIGIPSGGRLVSSFIQTFNSV